jgi:hypothetical protein
MFSLSTMMPSTIHTDHVRVLFQDLTLMFYGKGFII